MTTATGVNGADKGNKFANAGAAAGGFFGAMGASFVPPINVTINRASGKPKGGQFVLGDPEFNNGEDIRLYTNHARALMVQASIELAMAAKILEARLGQAPAAPGDNPIQSKLRAKRVSWKLKRAADGAKAAAKNATATHAAFQREYADVMRPRPRHQHISTNPFRP